MVTCCLDSLHALVNSSRCRTVKGLDELLTSQVKTIFEEYDNYCAHGRQQTYFLSVLRGENAHRVTGEVMDDVDRQT